MRSIPGLNIQWPWSQLLLSGKKTIETRGYPLPDRLIGLEMAIIETPGPKGKAEAGIEEARIVGLIIFDKIHLYNSQILWEKDESKHLVFKSDLSYAWGKRKIVWGWNVKSVTPFAQPVNAPRKKGIVFTKVCKIP